MALEAFHVSVFSQGKTSLFAPAKPHKPLLLRQKEKNSAAWLVASKSQTPLFPDPTPTETKDRLMATIKSQHRIRLKEFLKIPH
jgi:hypothetical protein